MKKISVPFVYGDDFLCTDEVRQGFEWINDAATVPTWKRDGTACAVINGELYARYDAKNGKTPPTGAIPCQEPDAKTGHWPHWVKCARDNPQHKMHFQAFDELLHAVDATGSPPIADGTFELCGPRINTNREQLSMPVLFRHGEPVDIARPFSLGSVREWMTRNPSAEGIVFHGADGRMAKITRSYAGFVDIKKQKVTR